MNSKNRKANYLILVTAVTTILVVLILLRNQVPIGDEQDMKAMIPHHSSAIVVSQKAKLEDPETRKLEKDIIVAQKKEIAQMKKLLYRLEERGSAPESEAEGDRWVSQNRR